MSDLLISKGSPYAFAVIVAWSLDAPRQLMRGVLFEMCSNACAFFAMLAGFFR
jgi:hypothetical protein